MVDVAERTVVTKMLASSCGFDDGFCATDFVFQVADATNLADFDDNSFDMVVSIFGIIFIPDRDATLSAIRRVLKKETGCCLALATWTTTEGYSHVLKDQGFGANMDDATTAMKVYPKGTLPEQRSQPGDGGGGGGGHNANVLRHTPPPLVDWFHVETIRQMLCDRNRFGHVTVRRAMHTTSFASVEQMWQAFTSSSPYFALSDHDPDQVAMAKQALSDFVQEGDDGTVDDNPVFVLAVSNLVVAS